MAANVATAATMVMGIPPVNHITDAAENIDNPKCHTRHITKKQTQRACHPE